MEGWVDLGAIAQAEIRTRNLPIANPADRRSTTQPLAHLQTVNVDKFYRLKIEITWITLQSAILSHTFCFVLLQGNFYSIT